MYSFRRDKFAIKKKPRLLHFTRELREEVRCRTGNEDANVAKLGEYPFTHSHYKLKILNYISLRGFDVDRMLLIDVATEAVMMSRTNSFSA
ncbi:hypothetical protein EVAR_47778_1 [Eumeta japonica]|uniref:Uncharacterized protein n=1 Tax=Eumeta variegata TaxID=151549 RepID=A0A4C1XY76_EUMVA|nr:hypothetical protein EVAR_47778_1 [Eumeta japonica]